MTHKKSISLFISIVGILLFTANAFAVLEIPNTQPKVSATQWNAILDKTWDGIKERNIKPYSIDPGLIHRPKSETPGDAVSEGVGYGMIVALFSNDQATFNTIWEAANTYMWSGCYYDWFIGPTGSKEGNSGAAADAEEDIALALIFADKLVSEKRWTDYSSSSRGSYATHAQKILDCMWSTKQITDNGILAPGAGWGGYDFVNPGYFSPAWYRIFKNFDSNSNHNWDNVINQSYTIIEKSPGYAEGLIPDWMTPSGSYTSAMGYNTYLSGHAFFKDAIRTLWRVAIDAIWFDEARAKAYLTNALAFINSKGGAEAANFYQIEGNSLGQLIPADDKWFEFNGKTDSSTWRYRREHSHLSIGMWATAAMAVGTDEDKIAFSKELSKYYEYDAKANFFGLITDTTGMLEDTLHNEMYFDQFLAWFGASLMSGVFNNVIENLDNPKTNEAGITYDPFVGFSRPVAPKSGFLTLQCQSEGVLLSAPAAWQEVQWKVYNLQGSLVQQTRGKSLQLSNQKFNGVLLVQAESKYGTLSKKIFLR